MGCLRNQKGRDHTACNMSSVWDSSSEATNSDEEAITQGMMHLAIACTHVQQVSTKETLATGNPCIFLTCLLLLGLGVSPPTYSAASVALLGDWRAEFGIILP